MSAHQISSSAISPPTGDIAGPHGPGSDRFAQKIPSDLSIGGSLERREHRAAHLEHALFEVGGVALQLLREALRQQREAIGDGGEDRVDRLRVVDGERVVGGRPVDARSEEHTSELQSLMRISYAVFCLKKKKQR